MTGRAARLLPEERGQAVVELACVVPVVLACALVAVNLGVYIERCARFDRVAPDMVLAHGIAPADEQDASSAVRQVREAVEEAMGDPGLEVDVRVERLDPEEGAERVVNLVRAWTHEIQEMMGGMGINAVDSLRGNRLMLRGIGLTDRELDILGVKHAGE